MKKKLEKKSVEPGAIKSPIQQQFKFTMYGENESVKGPPGEVGMTIEFGLFEEEE